MSMKEKIQKEIEEKKKRHDSWAQMYFNKPSWDKVSDKELFEEFQDLSLSMDVCFGTKDVMALELIARELEDRGFDIEEYNAYHVTIDDGEPKFDEKGNAIREPEED